MNVRVGRERDRVCERERERERERLFQDETKHMCIYGCMSVCIWNKINIDSLTDEEMSFMSFI